MIPDIFDSNIYESAVLVKLFFNEKLRDKYLLQLLPMAFSDKYKRLIIFAMQKMYIQKLTISLDNITLFIRNRNESLEDFIKRNNISGVTDDKISNILLDTSVDSSEKLFDEAIKILHHIAFSGFVDDSIEKMKYWNSYSGMYEHEILSRTKGIIELHKRFNIYKSSENKDQLLETQMLINSMEEYIPTSSQLLNSYIGGFTRGYVASIIAKSSHCKSSWTDFNSIHTIAADKVNKIAIITPEEAATARWRRIIAMLCHISTSDMRQKLVKITTEHIEIVRAKFENRYIIYDSVFAYKDIIDLQYSLDVDMIIVDHLQSIDYPGQGDHMHRMIGSIPGFVAHQKRIAKKKNIPIIDLSQVGDKEIQRSGRTNLAPRYYDAYGNSALYQASREFLALWYPVKDYEESPIMFGDTPPTINDFQIGVEKSSFSRVGKVPMKYYPDYSEFEDTGKMNKKMDYIPPKEVPLEQIDMFKKGRKK
jgi:replicative DNA helicase